ncbi:MAG: glycoside hydrolase family 9 protein [Oscillospiraceae bacterium]
MDDIFVDQAGYTPAGIKRAAMTAPAEIFYIKDETGSVFYEGRITDRGFDKPSGDNVYIADFTEFSLEGVYRIEADNGMRSAYFSIGGSVFQPVLDALTKAFYYLRCGCGLDEKYAGKFRHGKCHSGKALLWEDNSVSMEVSGGWHDAGDYGRYVTAGACALAHLLYAYKLYPEVFAKQELNIPKSGDMPDILAECRVELEWLIKMQRPDGGVYHKATTARHAAFVMPEADTAQMFVLPVSSMATADLAAVCALAYGIYAEYDRDFALTLREAALRSAGWLDEHTEFIGFENPEGCTTGGYGERTDTDNRFWAYAELFAATGDMRYHKKMESVLESNDIYLAGLGYAAMGGLGALAYLLCGREECSEELKDKFRTAFISAADRAKSFADSSGYGAAMRHDEYFWGSNMTLLKRGMIFAIADTVCGRSEYASYARAQADVLLGLNPTGYSYVTGIGGKCCNNPHLRPAAADGIDECIPGFVSGGPNSHPPEENARQYIPKDTPPMKCYADAVELYSVNEVAIYWNSPAVFLISYIISK